MPLIVVEGPPGCGKRVTCQEIASLVDGIVLYSNKSEVLSAQRSMSGIGVALMCLKQYLPVLRLSSDLYYVCEGSPRSALMYETNLSTPEVQALDGLIQQFPSADTIVKLVFSPWQVQLELDRRDFDSEASIEIASLCHICNRFKALPW